MLPRTSLVAQVVKNLPVMQEEARLHPWVRKIPWRREWQPTLAFLPGESHGQRNLAGYSSWDHKESDTTEPPTLFTFKKLPTPTLFLPSASWSLWCFRMWPHMACWLLRLGLLSVINFVFFLCLSSASSCGISNWPSHKRKQNSGCGWSLKGCPSSPGWFIQPLTIIPSPTIWHMPSTSTRIKSCAAIAADF